MNVLVLEGGISDERAVSLRSAAAVKTALEQTGHTVLSYDTKQGLAGLKAYQEKADVVFPVLHGTGGEDGELQQVLQELALPFVGAGAEASALCFDKAAFKDRVRKMNILTPDSVVCSRSSIEAQGLLTRPYVLKPTQGGSSINTHIVRRPNETKLDFDEVFKIDSKMLLEELISGDELTVPILGNTALPVIEIIPPKGLEFDYENKYNGATQELCPPKNVSLGLQRQVQQIAEKIHTELGVRHLSRTDFIIRDSELYVLELNTLPGLTSQSLFPKSALVAGITMPELVDNLVRQALSK